MPARSVCLVVHLHRPLPYHTIVTLSLSEAGPGRFSRQVSVTDIYHTIPYHTIPNHTIPCNPTVASHQSGLIT